MYTAKEAREKVTEVKLKALAGIENKIKDAAEQGLECIWEDCLETIVIDELEKAGYKVTYHDNYTDFGEYCISWKEDKNGNQSKNY